MNRGFTIILTLCLGVLGHSLSADTPDDKLFHRTARKMLHKHCASCHNEVDKKGGINLEDFYFATHVISRGELFKKVTESVEEGTMPPSQAPAMSQADRDTLIYGIEKILSKALAKRDPGKSVMRRLSHREYQYTVKDLMGVDFETVHFFPSEGSGGGGFDNQSGGLFVSPLTMERYYNAADSLVRQIRSNDKMWRNIVREEYTAGLGRRIINSIVSLFRPDEPVYWEKPVSIAKKTIIPFASKAYRRFISQEEEDKLVDFFKQVYFSSWKDRDAFDEAIAGVFKRILVSPNFLYRIEVNLENDEPYPINNFELATRISFLLWSSMPDERLLEVAYREDLHNPAILKREVLRMMEDPKFRRFSASFAPQWLGTEEMLYSSNIDREKFPELTTGLRQAMHEEVVGYFHEVFTEERNLLQLLDSDHAWLNEDLANHYGIEGVSGEEFRNVAINDRNRGGILGMGAVLTATSLPLRTSPVLRGQWVLEQVLGEPAPPPPADVPALEDAKKSDVSELDLRSLLELHRTDVACAGCHQKMDPIGLGLENYDAIGRWRENYDSIRIDPSGVLPDGRNFKSPADLKKILLADKKKFAKNFSRNMLSYALGRRVEFIDSPTMDRLVDELMNNNFDSQSFMLELVSSYPFQHRRSDLAESYKGI
ncbi:MAG: DUF1592 domain-containing protein [Saprospiraceae bacterium]|nr:DUF1592 domain-containing protein [Saprospiraceae bacterium]